MAQISTVSKCNLCPNYEQASTQGIMSPILQKKVTHIKALLSNEVEQRFCSRPKRRSTLHNPQQTFKCPFNGLFFPLRTFEKLKMFSMVGTWVKGISNRPEKRKSQMAKVT